MSETSDNSHYVRRVVLPSGRAIEVVYFEPAEDESGPGAAAPAGTPGESLHVCPECSADLVYPTMWEEADETCWEVTLRCPNCEHRVTGTWTQDVVDRFDEQLDRGTATLLRDLKRLTRANMEDEVERFVRALRAGAILPEDF